MSMNFIYGDSNLIVELKNVDNDPKVSKLELDDESYMQICLYGKCEIKITNSSFSTTRF